MKKLGLMICIFICALAAEAQMSEKEFEEILNQSFRKVSATNYEMTTFVDFKPIAYSRKIAAGKWEVGLNSWGPNNTTSTQDLLSTVAIVTLRSDGTGYDFISGTQMVDSAILESVKDYKYVRVGRKWLQKQMSYATVSFEWSENRHVTIAQSPLDGKAKKISEDLGHLLNVSRGMQNTVAMGVNKYN